MKSKSWIAALMAVVLAAIVMAFASPAFAGSGSGHYPSPSPTCIPSPGSPAIPPTYKEIPNPDYVPAVPGTPAVPAVPDVWQNFSPNQDQETFEGPPAWPTDPRGTWQHQDKPIPPGQAGPDGVYQNGNGNGDWFYRKAGSPAIPEVPGTPAIGEPTITVIDKPGVPAVPPVECPPEECPEGPSLTSYPDECPPPEDIKVEPTVDVHDVCGVENDGFVTGDEVGITYSYDGERFLTVTPETGYVIVLSEGSLFTLDEEGNATFDADLYFTDEPCDGPPVREDEVVVTEGLWACGDTTVDVFTETTVFSYEYVDGEWIESSETTEVVSERPLTQEELSECPLVPGNITSVCVGDVPFLSYAVTPPEGYVPSGPNPVTITFSNGSNSYTVPGTHPLSGTILWPGANVSPPQWPGWTLDGLSTTDDPARFGWTRTGVTVTFEINPTYSTVVAYPAATSACANPPAKVAPTVAQVNGVSPTSNMLAATGSEGVLSMVALAALLVALGGGATAIAVRRNK